MPDTDPATYRIMSPFEIYLRTGHRVKSMAEVERISLKFNHWHDPRDGRFTTSGAGTASGSARQITPSSHSRPRSHGSFKPGGGSFGGGGATGTWNKPQPQSTKPSSIPVRNAAVVAAALQLKPKNQSKPVVQPPQPIHHSIEVNGYRFDYDTAGRTQSVSGQLKLDNSQLRSRQEQANAGGANRKPGDEGGHYVALRFGGPPIPENHFAQDRNFNRGAYRVIEKNWAKALALGHRVSVKITPYYHDRSTRPEEISVQWKIDGHYDFKIFPNRFGGK